MERCITSSEFEKSGGIDFTDLPNGLYDLEIRVDSAAALHGNYLLERSCLYIPPMQVTTSFLSRVYSKSICLASSQ